MDPEHRKIELQSPADLSHLTTQLRTLARQKLDLHLPPQPDTSTPDDLRAQVEGLVDAFVAQLLAGMRQNISINGVDVIPRGAVDENGEMVGVVEDEGEVVIEEFEAFDEKLRKRVGAAVEKRDRLVEAISKHRRETGRAAARRWEEEWVRSGEGLVAPVVQGEQDVDVGGVEALKRQEEVERAWGRAVEGLGRLNGGLPETRARLERAGEVVGYLGGKREG
ncbi:hypothetical protein DPSP01_000549 [Paraphaeosphaeria sporulosa]|uniref:Mis14-domain-containing protein n=1 Tax=Paraphaeosphaeria sporulosa TaxID=1460663 RepID=A0A177C9Y8_9PLEO|nr:uncharacterized protein CC84DRAFT_1260776 [Paraphaeosphaeria sporulosa]OAG03662.1 hypothetical protein CC84DRAFT_1260776 [Paraphaeosphaeria sporulosa]